MNTKSKTRSGALIRKSLSKPNKQVSNLKNAKDPRCPKLIDNDSNNDIDNFQVLPTNNTSRIVSLITNKPKHSQVIQFDDNPSEMSRVASELSTIKDCFYMMNDNLSLMNENLSLINNNLQLMKHKLIQMNNRLTNNFTCLNRNLCKLIEKVDRIPGVKEDDAVKCDQTE